jgi:hypothetical protein
MVMAFSWQVSSIVGGADVIFGKVATLARHRQSHH